MREFIIFGSEKKAVFLLVTLLLLYNELTIKYSEELLIVCEDLFSLFHPLCYSLLCPIRRDRSLRSGTIKSLFIKDFGSEAAAEFNAARRHENRNLDTQWLYRT